MFVATVLQLAAQLPDWRVPLVEPQRRTIENPFTGASIPNVLTRDPGPLSHPLIPSALTFPSVILPSREDWEQNYLALDLALSGEPPLSTETWEDGWFDLMWKRQFFVEPLLGGTDDIGDSRDLHEVPARLVVLLAQLRPDAVNAMAANWLARCYEPADAPAEFLARFCELARISVSNEGRLFTWNINPLHRERSG